MFKRESEKRGLNLDRLAVTVLTTLLMIPSVCQSDSDGYGIEIEGVVSYWSFDDQANPGKDDFGGNDGTVTGAVWTSEGKVNGALSFDGVDDYVNFGSDNSLSLSTLTISAWVYDQGPGTIPWRTIIDKSRGSSRNGGYALHVGISDVVRLFLADGVPRSPTFTTSATLPSNQWVHVAATYDGTNITGSMKIYFNGIEQAGIETDYGTYMMPNTLPVLMGTYDGYNGKWNGMMDEVAIFDRPLTEDEIQQLYESAAKPVINWASMNIWDSPGFELFMWATGNFDVILEDDDIALYANGERLPMELIEQDGGFVHAYGAPGPPLPTEYEVTIRDRWATSEPYLIGVLKGYPQGAPEMLYPEDGQLITETQPTFRWEDFKSLYDGQPIDAGGYEINLTFPNGLTYTVCPISGDQITLDYINPHWTPSQPPAMLPGIYGVTLHSVHSVAPGFGFEHHGGIHFEVVEDPVQLLESLAQDVIDLNLHSGIENSLDAKLDAALKAIEDLNQNNDVAAINALEAFINAVEAQRGNKIPEADADDLIAAAQQIIDLLTTE